MVNASENVTRHEAYSDRADPACSSPFLSISQCPHIIKRTSGSTRSYDNTTTHKRHFSERAASFSKQMDSGQEPVHARFCALAFNSASTTPEWQRLGNTLRGRASYCVQANSSSDAHSPASHSDRISILPSMALGELTLRRQRCTAMLYAAQLSPQNIPSVAGKPSIITYFLLPTQRSPTIHEEVPRRENDHEWLEPHVPHRHQPRRYRRQGLRSSHPQMPELSHW